MAVYEFPFSNREDYKGTITFRPIDNKPPSIGNLRDLYENLGIKNTVEAFQTAAGDFIGTDGETAKRAEIVEAEPKADKTAVVKKDVPRPLPNNRVTLYLPQAISISDGASYDDNIELGTLGGVFANALESGETVRGAIQKSIVSGAATITDLFKQTDGSSAIARLAAVRAADTYAPDRFANSIRSVAKVAVNPNKRSLFMNVSLRQFTFSFKMIATSKEEAQAIRNIIKFFRTEMYPRAIKDAELIGYEVPRRIQIEMEYNGKPVATKIQPSYIKSVNTVYNPSSMGWHIDGEPSEVDLSLTFGEERALDRGDIERGY